MSSDFIGFLLASSNLPFAVSGVFLLLLFALEVIGVLFAGMGVSHLADMLEGKDHDFSAGGFAADAFGYLHWGKVPAIVIISALTGLFALSGYGLQSISQWLLDGLLPGWLASIPAFAAAVTGTHFVAKPLARLMPSDTGDAVTEKDLLGMAGVIIAGPVKTGRPGEARIRDLKGQHHIVRITGAPGDPELPVGTEIVLSALSSSFYTARPTAALPHSNLPAAIVDGAETKPSIHVRQENKPHG